MIKKENKFGYFNILRFVGAICIAILLHWNDHVLPALGQQNNLLNVSGILFYISKNSYVFTEMFYLISGFLFAKVYINRITKGKGITFKKFMLSRYIRIFPLVIISTIVMYFFHLIYYNKFNVFFSCGSLKLSRLFFDIFFSGTLTFGSNIHPLNGPLWYIGPLMLCYIIGYYLTKWYKKNKNYYVYIIPIIIGIFILNTNFNFFIFNTSVGRGLISFFIGILLGNKFLQTYFDNLSFKNKLKIKTILFLLIALYIYIIISGNSDLYIGDYLENILTCSLIFFPLIIIFLYDIKWINNLGNTKLFKFLGKISFSIYIWNFPIIIILVFMIKIGILSYLSDWQFMILNFIIHIFVASISYIFIEKKYVNKLKNRRNK